MHYCVHQGNLEMVRWLERKGASIHMIDEVNALFPFFLREEGRLSLSYMSHCI
jgi:hypothetical protein